MRVEDDYKYAGYTHGLYDEDNLFPDFRRYLDLAESRKGLLPKWWNQDKRRMCERVAGDDTEWAHIGFAVEKGDIIEHYGDPMMLARLRMLAERVYGEKIDMGY